MEFQVCHENDTSVRLRLDYGTIKAKEEKILSEILSLCPQIMGIQIYPATSGLRIFFKGDKEKILQFLKAISYRNVRFFAEELKRKEDFHVQLLPSGKEILHEFSKGGKKMPAPLKKKIGKKIGLEAIADMVLPHPLSLAYHVYQLLLLYRT